MKSLFAFALILTALCSPVWAGDGWTAPPPPPTSEPLGLQDISQGWFEVAIPRHYSLSGTRFTHGFLTEPAFACRSIRADFWHSDSNEWATLDASWAFTRRLSVDAQVPFGFDIGDETGFGDSSLALKGLLYEDNRLLFSQSFKFGLPIGDETRGLGTGDLSLATSSHAWFDTGWWQVTLQGQAGFSYVPDNGNWSFDWGATLAKDICGTNFYALAEVRGSTPIDWSGETEGLWLLGGGYRINENIGLRAGFTCDFNGEPGVVAGFSFDF